MAESRCPRRKFGPIAYTIGFGFIVFGVALYQLVLRDHLPPITFGGGWYDWGRGLGSAVFGGLSGLIGGLLGSVVERKIHEESGDDA